MFTWYWNWKENIVAVFREAMNLKCTFCYSDHNLRLPSLGVCFPLRALLCLTQLHNQSHRLHKQFCWHHNQSGDFTNNHWSITWLAPEHSNKLHVSQGLPCQHVARWMLVHIMLSMQHVQHDFDQLPHQPLRFMRLGTLKTPQPCPVPSFCKGTISR